jgi:hypothetical protein
MSEWPPWKWVYSRLVSQVSRHSNSIRSVRIVQIPEQVTPPQILPLLASVAREVGWREG